MKVFIRGLNGCVMRRQKLLQYRNFLVGNGHTIVGMPAESDIILVWGCAFRSDFRDSSLAVIEHYFKDTRADLIVTGCLVDIAPERIIRDPRIKLVAWRDDAKELNRIFAARQDLDSFLPVFAEGRVCQDTAKFRMENPEKDATFHDQFIKLVVAEGCHFKCAYCSERLAFPPFRSFAEDKIIASCRKMIEETKVTDVMLLADNLGQYGQDTGSSFPSLVRKLKSIHPDITFAFNNLNPVYFLKFIKEMRFFIKNGYLKHLNLPIQSASDKILKLMNRPYRKKDLVRMFDTLRELQFKSFDTHVVVGFPGETDEDLSTTIDFLLQFKPRYVLASRYMEANRAPSAKLPDKVDEATTLRRLNRIARDLNQAGILCNTDESELSKKRIDRLMHRDQEKMRVSHD